MIIGLVAGAEEEGKKRLEDRHPMGPSIMKSREGVKSLSIDFIIAVKALFMIYQMPFCGCLEVTVAALVWLQF